MQDRSRTIPLPFVAAPTREPIDDNATAPPLPPGHRYSDAVIARIAETIRFYSAPAGARGGRRAANVDPYGEDVDTRAGLEPLALTDDPLREGNADA